MSAPSHQRPWRHELCGCMDDVHYCCTGMFSPCLIMSDIAEEMGKNRICWCIVGAIPGLNLVSLAHLRSMVRKKLGIEGSVIHDNCISCWCTFCSLMQVGQETKNMRECRLSLPSKGSWKNRHLGPVITSPPKPTNNEAPPSYPGKEVSSFSIRL